MSEKKESLPNLRTVEWRQDQVSHFTTNFSDTTQSITALLHGGQPKNTIKEAYRPDIPDAYILFGSSTIEGALRMFELSWNPCTKTLDRSHLMLQPGLENQGYGTQINEITELLAKKLGAKKLIISLITNQDWEDKLLRDGFLSDPKRPHQVYKEL